MNLRRRKPHDSLYMLLDTMCNAFGGIILLAVLVTLLTSKERDVATGASDTQGMLLRRLAIAKATLQQSLQLESSLQAKADSARWKKQMTLLDTRRQIQRELEATRELAAVGTKELDTVASSGPTERMKSLNAQLASAKMKKLELQNSLAASQDSAKHLGVRLTNMANQAANLVAQSQRQVRLPREHETGKRVIYVIARYGRIYPCRNSDLSRNEIDLEWTSGFSNEIAEPKPGRGLEPSNTAALRTYFGNLSKNSAYVAFCVFEDSFPSFIVAKQLASESGLAFGWEPFQISDGPISFGSVGYTPKPQ